MTDEKNEDIEGIYFDSFDTIRMVCMVLIVIMEFGLNFIPYFSFAQPFLNFAAGTLFTLYGFIVLRDGADLTKNIRHAFKVFLIMFAVYGIMTELYLYLTTGNLLAGITKRGIFNFVVLNYWGTPFCSSIWYVQSTLYALIVFYIFRKLKKADWFFCILLFAVTILTGEFANIIHFSVLGYNYIPGNFVTRTMPYMLLGRIICRFYEPITDKMHHHPAFYFITGLLMSVAEFLALGFSGNLIYSNHFIGFIIMAAILCIYGASDTSEKNNYVPLIYKGMYYVYNPLGYILIMLAGFICTTGEQYTVCVYMMGIVVLILTIVTFWLIGFIREEVRLRIQEKKEMKEIEEKVKKRLQDEAEI